MEAATVEPSVSSLTSFVGGFHPVVVHLPIGIFVLAVGLELLAVRRRLAPAVDGAQSLVLGAATASALLAFVLGVALGSGGGYPVSLLDRHRAFATATVVGVAASGVAWWAHRHRGAPRLLPRAVMGLTLVAITITGHLGGSLSRGEGHLLASAPPVVRRLFGAGDTEPRPPASAVTPSHEPRVFEDVVRPVLAARCVGCHGPARAKGRLRLDDLEAIRRGGASGSAIVAGDAASSLLVERVHLPLTDEKHMPPEGEDQLTEAEVAIIGFWIDRGATTDLRVRDTMAPAAARPLLESAVARVAAPPAPAAPASPPSSPAASSPSHRPVDAPPASTPMPAAPGSTSRATAAPPPTLAVATPYAPRQPAPGWDAVQDVLDRRCARCHGPRKKQGGLRVDSIEALERGGDGGPAIVRGRPGAGTLLARLHAPLDDVDHMPPEDEPQLTPAELQLLTAFAGGSAAPRAPAPGGSGAPPIPTTAVPPAAASSVPVAPTPSAAPAADAPATAVPPPGTAASTELRRPRDAAPRPPPAAGGGCLSCAVGADRSPGPSSIALGAWLAAACLAVLRRAASRRARRDPRGA